ncbi:MAG: hypothetical protein QOJ59_4498 [Thermomicrobiales bacterium]|nr:hypothetical protein [Thermomicrobiales bacterium]
MTARFLASSRLVLALTLLLSASAGVGAETAPSEVAVVASLFQSPVDDLGLAPHTVTISRIIFTPGAGDEAVTLPGPRLVFVEAGTLAFHASGDVEVIRAAAQQGPGPTATPTPAPTPTPARSPTTDILLNPGDAAPVPIWTMHALRNEGSEPAVILDVRITSGDSPSLPTNLDVELLAEETGLTTLPTGRASIALGLSTIAPGAMVLAPEEGRYQLVADAGGAGPVERAADGSVKNSGANPLEAYVLVIAQVGGAGRRGPLQPATGPGGAEVAFDRVVATYHGPEKLGYWLYEPADPHPGTQLPTAGPMPVVLFLGGCCVRDGDLSYGNPPLDVQAWLDHLTQRGAIVIYPVVQPDRAQEDTVAAMRAATAELGTGGHVQADWSRFAVIGYSFGGWNAPIYANSAAAEGLPVPQAIFSTVAYDPGTPPDLSAIPASTRVVVLVDDDDYGWSDHGARRIWAALTTVAADRRAFVHLVSDTRGIPALIANHQLPATGDYGTVNALDWYGTWKLGDALLSCTFGEQDCHYAFGDTPELRFMGYWSDGVPVKEIEVIADPGPPDPATPTP